MRVRTLQGGIERRSWQVFYMPRVFEAASNATPDLFPQLSSPTEEIAGPGQICDVGPGSGQPRGSANEPSSRLAREGRSCSWIFPFPSELPR